MLEKETITRFQKQCKEITEIDYFDSIYREGDNCENLIYLVLSGKIELRFGIEPGSLISR